MNYKLLIRQERECDFGEIRSVIKTAFVGIEHTDGDEYNLVDRLRGTEEYIPELSLVAEVNGRIVGYAMFSQIPFKPELPHGTVRYSQVFGV